MANYNCTYRTNYFRVTDEKRYQRLIGKLSGEDLEILDDESPCGKHGFGGTGSMSYCSAKDDLTEDSDGMDIFYEELQKILPDGEAMILQEAGYEKLRYVTGFATIVTNKEIRFLNLSDIAVKTAGEMLGIDFQTQMDY